MAQIIKDTIKSTSFPKITALESSKNQIPFTFWDVSANTKIWEKAERRWDISSANQDIRRKFAFEPESLRRA